MHTEAPSFLSIINPYKIQIENSIQSYIHDLGEKSPLRDACEYALMNGGKRFRPTLVLMIAKALGHHIDVTPAAMGIEFFHTASLIADDLPCMDNDDMRRDKPSLHKKYGESIALLATYALISAGYELLAKNAQKIGQSQAVCAKHSDTLCRLALENVSHNTGILGATGGQFLDILPPNLTWETLRDIIHKKTITLFEISFVLGWIFGGGDLSKLPVVKKSAEHFGLAFQIADDLGDQEQDIKNNRLINVANVCGSKKALELFHAEILQFKLTLNELGLNLTELQSLVQLLETQANSIKS